MHVSFALFADAANLSQEGKLNILGVFDALQVATLPAIHPRAHLVVHLKGSGVDMGSHTVSFRWLSPSGQELWNSSGDLNVGAPPPGVAEMDLPLIAQLDLPMDLYTESMPDEPTTKALLYGPVVLAGKLGTDGLNKSMIVGPKGPAVALGTGLEEDALAVIEALVVEVAGEHLAHSNLGAVEATRNDPVKKISVSNDTVDAFRCARG